MVRWANKLVLVLVLAALAGMAWFYPPVWAAVGALLIFGLWRDWAKYKGRVSI